MMLMIPTLSREPVVSLHPATIARCELVPDVAHHILSEDIPDLSALCNLNEAMSPTVEPKEKSSANLSEVTSSNPAEKLFSLESLGPRREVYFPNEIWYNILMSLSDQPTLYRLLLDMPWLKPEWRKRYSKFTRTFMPE